MGNHYKKIKRKDGTTIDAHRLIAGAEKLPPDMVVHHIDGNRQNNDPENLQIMTRLEHLRLHGFGTTNRPTPIFKPDSEGMAVCRKCGRKLFWKEFPKDNSYLHGRSSECRECYNRNRREKRRKIAS